MEEKNKSGKEGSITLLFVFMLFAFIIAALWDKIPAIKNSIHYVFDPSAGALINWNLNIGMFILVLIITIITTLIQKYATDQKELKKLRNEQKEIQKQIKENKNNHEKLIQLQKKQIDMIPRQMKLGMRGIIYTGIPFILLFRWFNDYFISAGNPRFVLGLSWFWFYFFSTIIISSILRKWWDVV